MSLADVLRMVDVVLAAFVLAPACGIAIAFARSWDQRGRFAVVLGYAATTIGGQLDALGRPLTWPVVVLAATTALASVTVPAFLFKLRHEAVGGGAGDRPRARQRPVLGAGPATGGGRHAGHGEGAQSGGAAT